jgi:hypothetical protein
LTDVESHCASQEALDAGLGISKFSQGGVYPVLSGVGFQGIENVAVSVAVAAENTPKQRANSLEILEINPSPWQEVGFSEI